MRAIRLLVTEAWAESPATFLLAFVETLGRVLELSRPVFLGLLVGGLVSDHPTSAVLGALGFAVAAGLGEAFMAVGVGARVRLMERLGFRFDQKILGVLGRLPTIEHLQDDEVNDRIRLLTEEQGALGLGINRLLYVVNNLVFAMGTILVAVTASWWMAIPLLAGAAALLSTRWVARAEQRAEQDSARPGRMREELADAMADPSAAEDAAVHDMHALLRRRLGEVTQAWRLPTERTGVRVALLEGAESILFFVAAGAAMVLTIRDASVGLISAGAVAQAFLLVTRLAGVAPMLKFTSTMALRSIRSMDRYLWLVDRAAAEAQPARVPANRMAAGVVVDHASYRYPGASSDALSNVTLTLAPGEVVVLLGDNGSGKSTLVNLMLGLLRPTSGAVQVGGSPASERQRVSMVSQDFVRYELTPRDAVGFGDVERIDDGAHLRDAARLGGAATLVDGLLGGWEQQLGTGWVGGVDLSQGQWQRLALARGLVRQGSMLMCFDEPSSTLDPEAERVFVESLATGEARRALGDECTVVFVTHRLLAARMADRVVVLDRGRVVEQGTPVDLLRTGGRFAELHALQSEAYQGDRG